VESECVKGISASQFWEESSWSSPWAGRESRGEVGDRPAEARGYLLVVYQEFVSSKEIPRGIKNKLEGPNTSPSSYEHIDSLVSQERSLRGGSWGKEGELLRTKNMNTNCSGENLGPICKET